MTALPPRRSAELLYSRIVTSGTVPVKGPIGCRNLHIPRLVFRHTESFGGAHAGSTGRTGRHPKGPADDTNAAAQTHRPRRRGAVARAGVRPAGDDGRRRRHDRAVPARGRGRSCRCRPSTGWCAPSSTWATCARSRRRQYALGPRLIRARRDAPRDARASGPAPPRPAGRRPRRVGQPGHARRRPDRLRRAGAVAAARCGCSPRSAARSSPHCTAVGKAILAGEDRRSRCCALLRAHRHGGAHRAHHHRPRRLRRGLAWVRRARVRHRRRGAGARRALRRRGGARRAVTARHVRVRAGAPDDRAGSSSAPCRC